MSSSTPNLHTLPTELLLSIALSLDLPTAVSFARVARRLTGPAEYRIWRDLEVIDSTIISRPGLIDPGDAVLSLMRVSESDIVRRLLRHHHAIRSSATRRKWRIVESLRMTTRPGVRRDMAELLEHTAETLRFLEIHNPGGYTCSPSSGDKTLEQTLHLRIYHDGLAINFPHLLTIILDSGALTHVEFIPVLCTACPLLIHLEFSIDEDVNRLTGERPAEIQRNRLVKVDTQLQILRVSYSRPYAGDEEEIRNEEYDSFNTILSLLKHSPLIWSLAIAHQPSLAFDEPRDSRIPVSIGKMANLRDLDCTAAEMRRVDFLLSDPMDLPCELSVKRMRITYSDWEIPSPPVGRIPTMPELEVLFLTCAARWDGALDTLLRPGYVYHPRPSALLWLRSTPRLHTIQFHRSDVDEHLDASFERLPELEAAGLTTCQIWSIRYGDEEVIHGRLKLYDIEEKSEEPAREKKRWRILHSSGEGEDDLKDLASKNFAYPISERFDQWFADYNGKDVPVDVMVKIREIEGVTADADWKRRGVEVGADAWQVLLDWEEGANATAAS